MIRASNRFVGLDLSWSMLAALAACVTNSSAPPAHVDAGASLDGGATADTGAAADSATSTDTGVFAEAATVDGGTTPRPPAIYVANAGSNAVTVYAIGAQGNVAPIHTIAGTNTGLSLPIGLAVDSQNNLYVANRTGMGVTVYPSLADGNVTPTRTLTATGMGSAQGLVLNPTDDVFVSSCPGCGSSGGGQVGVFHFPHGSSQSDSSIAGMTNTGLTDPSSLAMDEMQNLYVGNSFGGTVNVFAPGASGDVMPTRTLAPGGSANLQGIAYGDGTLFVSAPGVVIDEYASTATDNATPSMTIASSAMLPVQYPGGMAIDTSVTPPIVYLVDFQAPAIYVIQTAGVAPSLTVASVTTIAGTATALSQPVTVMVVR